MYAAVGRGERLKGNKKVYSAHLNQFQVTKIFLFMDCRVVVGGAVLGVASVLSCDSSQLPEDSARSSVPPPDKMAALNAIIAPQTAADGSQKRQAALDSHQYSKNGGQYMDAHACMLRTSQCLCIEGHSGASFVHRHPWAHCAASSGILRYEFVFGRSA